MIRVLHGDCLELLPTLSGLDACICDPPYHLTSIVKRFGGENAAPAQFGADGAFARASRGFMGRTWDGGDIALRSETWRLVYDALKPGAHLVAFGGTRTFHRMACAIEDAGFEIRDTLMWLYSQGFPKSHNLDNSDACCRCATNSHTVRNMRRDSSAVSVAHQTQQSDILQLQLPKQDVCGSVQSDFGAGDCGGQISATQSEVRGEQPSMEGRSDIPQETRELCVSPVCEMPDGVPEYGTERRLCDGTSSSDGSVVQASVDADGMRASLGSQPAQQCTNQPGVMARQSEPQTSGAWPVCSGCGKPIIPNGLGTALKPAFEPIILARKPLSEGTIAANVLAHGTGAINIDACRVEAKGRPLIERDHQYRPDNVDLPSGSRAIGTTDQGRWPANVLHSGDDEVEAAFAAFGERAAGAFPAKQSAHKGESHGGFKGDGIAPPRQMADTGTASRFFYCAKASKADRAGSKHPTVKPQALMRWLCRLVTPPGGTILDCFAGSGSTGAAAMREGFNAVLIEREAEYIADINRRIEQVEAEATTIVTTAQMDMFA